MGFLFFCAVEELPLENAREGRGREQRSSRSRERVKGVGAGTQVLPGWLRDAVREAKKLKSEGSGRPAEAGPEGGGSKTAIGEEGGAAAGGGEEEEEDKEKDGRSSSWLSSGCCGWCFLAFPRPSSFAQSSLVWSRGVEQ